MKTTGGTGISYHSPSAPLRKVYFSNYEAYWAKRCEALDMARNKAKDEISLAMFEGNEFAKAHRKHIREKLACLRGVVILRGKNKNPIL